jgi:hypothetical protein
MCPNFIFYKMGKRKHLWGFVTPAIKLHPTAQVGNKDFFVTYQRSILAL